MCSGSPFEPVVFNALLPFFCPHSSSIFLSCVKVWKQKGEEYRVTGYGGWSWISRTYVQRFVPRLPGNTNANYRKELEGQRQEMGGKNVAFNLVFQMPP